MTAIVEWLKEEKRRELTENEEKVLDELAENAKFALYCQTGGGQCMGEFGKKVVVYASMLGVKSDILFRKLVDDAVERLKVEDFNF